MTLLSKVTYVVYIYVSIHLNLIYIYVYIHYIDNVIAPETPFCFYLKILEEWRIYSKCFHFVFSCLSIKKPRQGKTLNWLPLPPPT